MAARDTLQGACDRDEAGNLGFYIHEVVQAKRACFSTDVFHETPYHCTVQVVYKLTIALGTEVVSG